MRPSREDAPVLASDETLEGARVRRIAQDVADARHPSVRQPVRRRGRPVPLEERAHGCEGGQYRREHRVPIARVSDREGQHVRQLPGAACLKQASHAGTAPGTAVASTPLPGISRKPTPR